jgi:hypothetical protein
MAVKGARCVRAAKRSSTERSLTATAAKGTSTWAGATRFILGRSRPFLCFVRVQMSPVAFIYPLFFQEPVIELALI